MTLPTEWVPVLDPVLDSSNRVRDTTTNRVSTTNKAMIILREVTLSLARVEAELVTVIPPLLNTTESELAVELAVESFSGSCIRMTAPILVETPDLARVI